MLNAPCTDLLFTVCVLFLDLRILGLKLRLLILNIRMLGLKPHLLILKRLVFEERTLGQPDSVFEEMFEERTLGRLDSASEGPYGAV